MREDFKSCLVERYVEPALAPPPPSHTGSSVPPIARVLKDGTTYTVQTVEIFDGPTASRHITPKYVVHTDLAGFMLYDNNGDLFISDYSSQPGQTIFPAELLIGSPSSGAEITQLTPDSTMGTSYLTFSDHIANSASGSGVSEHAGGPPALHSTNGNGVIEISWPKPQTNSRDPSWQYVGRCDYDCCFSDCSKCADGHGNGPPSEMIAVQQCIDDKTKFHGSNLHLDNHDKENIGVFKKCLDDSDYHPDKHNFPSMCFDSYLTNRAHSMRMYFENCLRDKFDREKSTWESNSGYNQNHNQQGNQGNTGDHNNYFFRGQTWTEDQHDAFLPKKLIDPITSVLWVEQLNPSPTALPPQENLRWKPVRQCFDEKIKNSPSQLNHQEKVQFLKFRNCLEASQFHPDKNNMPRNCFDQNLNNGRLNSMRFDFEQCTQNTFDKDAKVATPPGLVPVQSCIKEIVQSNSGILTSIDKENIQKFQNCLDGSGYHPDLGNMPHTCLNRHLSSGDAQYRRWDIENCINQNFDRDAVEQGDPPAAGLVRVDECWTKQLKNHWMSQEDRSLWKDFKKCVNNAKYCLNGFNHNDFPTNCFDQYLTFHAGYSQRDNLKRCLRDDVDVAAAEQWKKEHDSHVQYAKETEVTSRLDSKKGSCVTTVDVKDSLEYDVMCGLRVHTTCSELTDGNSCDKNIAYSEMDVAPGTYQDVKKCCVWNPIKQVTEQETTEKQSNKNQEGNEVVETAMSKTEIVPWPKLQTRTKDPSWTYLGRCDFDCCMPDGQDCLLHGGSNDCNGQNHLCRGNTWPEAQHGLHTPKKFLDSSTSLVWVEQIGKPDVPTENFQMKPVQKCINEKVEEKQNLNREQREKVLQFRLCLDDSDYHPDQNNMPWPCFNQYLEHMQGEAGNFRAQFEQCVYDHFDRYAPEKILQPKKPPAPGMLAVHQCWDQKIQNKFGNDYHLVPAFIQCVDDSGFVSTGPMPHDCFNAHLLVEYTLTKISQNVQSNLRSQIKTCLREKVDNAAVNMGKMELDGQILYAKETEANEQTNSRKGVCGAAPDVKQRLFFDLNHCGLEIARKNVAKPPECFAKVHRCFEDTLTFSGSVVPDYQTQINMREFRFCVYTSGYHPENSPQKAQQCFDGYLHGDLYSKKQDYQNCLQNEFDRTAPAPINAAHASCADLSTGINCNEPMQMKPGMGGPMKYQNMYRCCVWTPMREDPAAKAAAEADKTEKETIQENTNKKQKTTSAAVAHEKTTTVVQPRTYTAPRFPEPSWTLVNNYVDALDPGREMNEKPQKYTDKSGNVWIQQQMGYLPEKEIQAALQTPGKCMSKSYYVDVDGGSVELPENCESNIAKYGKQWGIYNNVIETTEMVSSSNRMKTTIMVSSDGGQPQHPPRCEDLMQGAQCVYSTQSTPGHYNILDHSCCLWVPLQKDGIEQNPSWVPIIDPMDSTQQGYHGGGHQVVNNVKPKRFKDTTNAKIYVELKDGRYTSEHDSKARLHKAGKCRPSDHLNTKELWEAQGSYCHLGDDFAAVRCKDLMGDECEQPHDGMESREWRSPQCCVWEVDLNHKLQKPEEHNFDQTWKQLPPDPGMPPNGRPKKYKDLSSGTKWIEVKDNVYSSQKELFLWQHARGTCAPSKEFETFVPGFRKVVKCFDQTLDLIGKSNLKTSLKMKSVRSCVEQSGYTPEGGEPVYGDSFAALKGPVQQCFSEILANHGANEEDLRNQTKKDLKEYRKCVGNSGYNPWKIDDHVRYQKAHLCFDDHSLSKWPRLSNLQMEFQNCYQDRKLFNGPISYGNQIPKPCFENIGVDLELDTWSAQHKLASDFEQCVQDHFDQPSAEGGHVDPECRRTMAQIGQDSKGGHVQPLFFEITLGGMTRGGKSR